MEKPLRCYKHSMFTMSGSIFFPKASGVSFLNWKVPWSLYHRIHIKSVLGLEIKNFIFYFLRRRK